MSEMKTELTKAFRDRQDKFVYYVMGLNVAAIGFTISKTFEIKIEIDHMYILVALLSWLSSILFGFYWINTQFNAMIQNILVFDAEEGHLDGKRISEENIEYTKDLLYKDIQKKSEKAKMAYGIMLYLFILGIVLFIFWRIAVLLHK